MWLARLAHSTCTAKSYLRTPDQRDYSSLDLEMLLQNGRQLQQKGECAQLMAVMWLQYRESTWPIIRRQLLPVSGICAIPPTHLNKQIHRDARQPQKCWNHKCHAWLFLFSNAWFFPKTSYMICTGTTLISCPYPYNPHSAAAQNQLELKLEMFSLCICIVDPRIVYYFLLSFTSGYPV